jgi:hypothetical protein
MTCIVGITSQGRTWIGADSCVSDDSERQSTRTPKLWRAGGYLIGAAGNGAWFAILRRVKWPAVASPGYITSGFVGDLVTAAGELGISMPAEEDSPGDGSALIGGAGRLWYVDSQLCTDEHWESACGSGGLGARCVLQVRRGPPKARIMAALRAVAAVRWDVAPPFVVQSA